MNTSTLVSAEVSSNSTTPSIDLIAGLEISVYSFSVLFGLPTQFYVIRLIVTGTKSRITSEFFNLNLSVCEMINCLTCLCFLISNWFLSIFTLTMSLSGLGITGRPLFQCLICVERYLAVVHPVTFLKFKPLRYRVICCTAAWIISLCSCLCCMLIANLLLIDGHSWFFLAQFLIFLSIQLFCCLAVLRALKQSGPGERWREREEINHMKRRAFYLILITTLNMVFMYTPLIITGCVTILLQQLNIRAVWLLSVISYALPGFVQPVLYLHRAGKLPCLVCIRSDCQ